MFQRNYCQVKEKKKIITRAVYLMNIIIKDQSSARVEKVPSLLKMVTTFSDRKRGKLIIFSFFFVE